MNKVKPSGFTLSIYKGLNPFSQEKHPFSLCVLGKSVFLQKISAC